MSSSERDTAQSVTPLRGREKPFVTSRPFMTTISEPTPGDKDSQSIAVTREGEDVIEDISDALDDNDG